MTVAVLALQGAFIEHEKKLQQLGAECIELRQASDLESSYDALVLPGGESTVQGKLLHELGMFDKIKKQIEDDMPVLATCAGMILLSSDIENPDNNFQIATMPIKVKRNAYGRQLGSFHTISNFADIGEVPMTFIRAPYVTKIGKDVQVLATVDDNIVAVRYKNQIALSFHPELDDDLKIHKMFLELCK